MISELLLRFDSVMTLHKADMFLKTKRLMRRKVVGSLFAQRYLQQRLSYIQNAFFFLKSCHLRNIWRSQAFGFSCIFSFVSIHGRFDSTYGAIWRRSRRSFLVMSVTGLKTAFARKFEVLWIQSSPAFSSHVFSILWEWSQWPQWLCLYLFMKCFCSFF